MKSPYIFATFALIILVVLVGAPADVIAQPPPALPDAPNQTPIDGGLLGLAVAGGAFAWRKLRSK